MKCFAPDMKLTTVDHIKKDAAGGERNVLVESARIARSHVQNLIELKSANFDAIAFPGGFGVAKNLCTWATQGANCDIHPEVKRVILDFYSESKPIGAMCIAPVLIAKVLGKNSINITIGNDPATAKEIEKTGAHHVVCPVQDYVSDREHKLVTTPAYMYGDAKPHEVFQGISGLVKELVEWA